MNKYFYAVRLSFTEENYIKAIYKLAHQGDGNVYTNDLSVALQNRAASVTDMLGKLSKKNLIEYKKYRGVSLTPKGKTIALGVIRKHRLWECFLVQKLNFSWDEIHEVAEQLEHIQSERLIERLEAFLDYPQHDPHGEPIPSAAGEMQSAAHVKLTETAAGDKVKVRMVSEENEQMLQQLDKHRIGIDTVLDVIFSSEDNGVVVKAARRRIALDGDTARHIFVQRIES